MLCTFFFLIFKSYYFFQLDLTAPLDFNHWISYYRKAQKNQRFTPYEVLTF